MAEAQRDLWPDLAVLEPLSTPLSLLKEQAAALARKTNGLLEGQVSSYSSGTDFIHSFKIVAPTIDNYSYELFRVQHDVLLYPAAFVLVQGGAYSPGPVVKTEQEFVAALKRILSSAETMRVISALLAQAKA